MIFGEAKYSRRNAGSGRVRKIIVLDCQHHLVHVLAHVGEAVQQLNPRKCPLIGTGIGSAMGWKDIDVHRKPSGEPFVVLEGGAKKLGEAREVIAVWITLSHTEHHAVAMIVIESESGSGG